MLVSVFADNVIYRKDVTRNEYILINGRKTGVTKCCGYCNCDQHPGYLNQKIMEEHECLDKECVWLYRVSDLVKQEKRLKQKDYKHKQKELHKMLQDRMDRCNELLYDYDGIKITSVSRTNQSEWQMKYVSICSIDKEAVINKLNQYFNGKIVLKEECVSFDDAVKIVYEMAN